MIEELLEMHERALAAASDNFELGQFGQWAACLLFADECRKLAELMSL